MQSDFLDHTDIAIIGAGPIGLLLANLLGKHGIGVRIVEERRDLLRNSMAIGITPSSLYILNALSMDQVFVDRGIVVTTVNIFENGKQLGDVDFSMIQADYPYMLSIPQSETVALLRNNMRIYDSIELHQGKRLVDLRQSGNHICYRLQDSETNIISEHTTSYLVGCDGHRSAVRQCAGIRFPGHSYQSRFCMVDFEDHTGWAKEARLFFSSRGAVESFPLPKNRRRWIVQLLGKEVLDEVHLTHAVVERISQRTGIELSDSHALFASRFQPQRHLASTYAQGRVLLCGDAAHVMSPIGGQGMNTGFADAAHLAKVLSKILDSPQQADTLFGAYTRIRQHAFNQAANRAASGMWLGTRTGIPLSLIRRLIMSHILLRPSVRDRLAASFAMLAKPGSGVPHAA